MKQIVLARQIGLAVRRKRQKLGMTQQQLADAAGVSRGFISRLEKGVSVAVYPEKLLEVLAALDLSLWISDSDGVDDVRAASPDRGRAGGHDASGGEVACGGGDRRVAPGETVIREGGIGKGGGSPNRLRRGGGGTRAAGVDIPPLQIDPALLKPFRPQQEDSVSVRERPEFQQACEEVYE